MLQLCAASLLRSAAHQGLFLDPKQRYCLLRSATAYFSAS